MLRLKDILTEENVGKKFKRNRDGYTMKIADSGFIIWDTLTCNASIHDEWEEVKEPVDFMTAFNAWVKKDKTISCVVLGEKFIIAPDDRGASFGANDIMGEWYIED